MTQTFSKASREDSGYAFRTPRAIIGLTGICALPMLLACVTLIARVAA